MSPLQGTAFINGEEIEQQHKRTGPVVACLDTSGSMQADILMISDGDCNLSDYFSDQLQGPKDQLNCMAYFVLCAGQRVKDNFSDEIVVL